MKKAIILAVIMQLMIFSFLAVSSTAADEDNSEETKGVEEFIGSSLEQQALDYIKEQYNNNIENIPSFAKKLIGTETINVKIALKDGTELDFYARTNKGIIEDLLSGESESPTLVVTTSEQVIEDIAESEDPVSRLHEALNKKEIDYKAMTFSKKVKWGLTKMATRVSGWFRWIFK